MQNPTTPVRVHVWVSGLVQGVGYRYSTVLQAKQFGLKGWVKNLADGRVEAVFEGDQDAVEAVLKWCRKGPAGSQVQEVKVEDETWVGETKFEIRRE